MRICMKCGEFYADALLAYCLADGAPLINVAAGCDIWSEGARVIEEKENALREQRRKLKRRRVVTSVVTTLIVTMVVCVVAVNSVIYLKPRPEEVALVPSSTPETDPTTTPTTTPTMTPTPSPTPSPSPTATPTPTPTPVYKISGRVTDRSKALGGIKITLDGAKSASTKTDANGNYTFSGLLTGGGYVITPARAKMDFTPRSRAVKNLTRDESADFVGTAQPDPPLCTEASEGSESDSIEKSFGGRWRDEIWEEREKIIARYKPVRVTNANVGNANEPAGFAEVNATLGELTYDIRFPKPCTASVTISYSWQITPTGRRARRFPPVEKNKTLVCKKVGAAWNCPAAR